ncbi:hypothetical protein [Streptomyces sp. NPDC046261]|uniref:hypothetical protein n=1 Tax=Streptomyces sp. NPDC046261 TaxID=3157200 RepID=UPI0033F2D1EA
MTGRTPERWTYRSVRAAFTGDYAAPALLHGTLAALALMVASVAAGTRYFRRAGA